MITSLRPYPFNSVNVFQCTYSVRHTKVPNIVVGEVIGQSVNKLELLVSLYVIIFSESLQFTERVPVCQLDTT